MSLTAAPEGWHGHLHRRRPLRGSSSITPHHHTTTSSLGFGGFHQLLPSPGEVGLSAWLTPRSRRVAVLRADGIKKALFHRRFFYLPFSAGYCLINGCVVRDPASRPHPAARPRQSTVAPTATIPYSIDLLGGNHFRHHLSPLRGALSSSAASYKDEEKRYRLRRPRHTYRRPLNGGVPSSCRLRSRAPPNRSNTTLGILEGIPRREGNPALPILPASFLFLPVHPLPMIAI